MSILLTACASKEDQARDLLATYQAAVAAGDMAGARQAMSMLVSVDEGNPEYWIALGQLHAQAGAFNDAFYALTRAHELDRGNLAVLQALTQMALRGGALDQAEDFAQQLELLAPGDPAVKMTYAYVALRRGDADKADRFAEQLLAISPYDSSARILKARVLLRQGKAQAAAELLKEQVTLQPGDVASLQALVGLLGRADDWAGVVTYGKRLLAQQPDVPGMTEAVIEAALRAPDLGSAREVTIAGLERAQTDVAAGRLLDVWVRLRPGSSFDADVRRLAQQAPPNRKLVYASYLNRVGDHRSAAALAEPLATLPVTAASTDANAVLATALLNMGQTEPASDRLNQVLSLDPGHFDALKARVELALRLRQGQRAIKDAQRLVSVAPSRSEAWIVQARVYSAVGNDREAGRTLWNAFHQISGDRNIYEALRVYVLRSQGPEAARRLAQEFADQRDAEMTREFV